MSSRDMQHLFNIQQYWERTLTDEFEIRRATNRLTKPRPNIPEGSRTQIWHYLSRDGRKVAVVHQYLRPDGFLGAYGRPDPVYLFDGGVEYVRDLTLDKESES